MEIQNQLLHFFVQLCLLHKELAATKYAKRLSIELHSCKVVKLKQKECPVYRQHIEKYKRVEKKRVLYSVMLECKLAQGTQEAFVPHMVTKRQKDQYKSNYNCLNWTSSAICSHTLHTLHTLAVAHTRFIQGDIRMCQGCRSRSIPVPPFDMVIARAEQKSFRDKNGKLVTPCQEQT